MRLDGGKFPPELCASATGKGWLELLAFSHRLSQEQFLFCMLLGFAFMFLFDGKRILLLYKRNRGGLRDSTV